MTGNAAPGSNGGFHAVSQPASKPNVPSKEQNVTDDLLHYSCAPTGGVIIVLSHIAAAARRVGGKWEILGA